MASDNMTLEVLETLKNDEKCIFCRHNEIDELRYGKMYKFGDIITHYFCMLFSANMEQNGEDEEGILGFLPEDIKKEEFRGNKLHCCYCHHAGATIGCFVKYCRKKFHYPCGIHHGSLHMFYGQFRSYCSAHRKSQNVPQSAVKLTEKCICVMCQDEVLAKPMLTTIWAPCCKTAWFHRTCVQKMAISAGYFFKCPNCNNKEIFRKEMLECGIYIPDQDAAWELEPNAFNELNERHSSCDAKNCACPEGRTFSEQVDDWEIILCSFCGSQGIHNKCWEILNDGKMQWICKLCSSISKTDTNSVPVIEEPGPSEVLQKHNGTCRPQNLRKEPSSSRCQRYSHRKRNLSPTSSNETESTATKVCPEGLPKIQDVYSDGNAKGEEELRIKNNQCVDGVTIDANIVELNSDDDDVENCRNCVKSARDFVERRLNETSVANSQNTSRNVSDIAPSIIIDLLDDSDDESPQNSETTSTKSSATKDFSSDDDDVIFVSCDPPKKTNNTNADPTALIRIVNENKVVIATPTDIRKSNLEGITFSESFSVTTNSLSQIRSNFHVLPVDRPSNENGNFVWQAVPLHKSHNNEHRQPQIISTISLGNNALINNSFDSTGQPSARNSINEKNNFDEVQQPNVCKEPTSWIAESEIIDLD